MSGGSPSPKDEVATRRKSYLEVVEMALALAALDRALMVLTAMAAGGGGGGGGDPQAQVQVQARSQYSSGFSGPGSRHGRRPG